MFGVPATTNAQRVQQRNLTRPVAVKPQQRAVRLHSDRSDGGFTAGFIVGGAIFGTLGFLFAPQISRALLDEDRRINLPKFAGEESGMQSDGINEITDPEMIKGELENKMNNMNSKIDELMSKLVDEPKAQVESPLQVDSSKQI